MSLRLPRPFTPEDLERLYACASKVERDVLTVLLETGMRSAEVRQITTEQVASWPKPVLIGDIEGVLTWIPEDHAVSVIGKGDKERVVLLTAPALLAAHRLAKGSGNGHMIPWSERGLRWKFEEMGKRAGIHAHVHRTRHTAITEWVEAGTPIEVVADMAGHASVDITRRYFAASIRLRREANRRRAGMRSYSSVSPSTSTT